jgi:hypothetical protein
VASGELTSVCCRMTDQAPPQPIAIPEWFREKLKGSGFGVQGSENAPLNPEP